MFLKRTASSRSWSPTHRRTRAERGSLSRWNSSRDWMLAAAGTGRGHPRALALHPGGLRRGLGVARRKRRESLLRLAQRLVRRLQIDRRRRLGLIGQHQHRVVLHLDEPTGNEPGLGAASLAHRERPGLEAGEEGAVARPHAVEALRGG